MLTADEFRAEQRGVARAAALAAALTCLAFGAAFIVAAAPDHAGPAERLAFTVRADTVVMLTLVAAVANVARLRFFSPHDIAGSAGGDPGKAVGRAGAILQNTLEQAVIAVFAHITVSLTVDAYRILVPTLVGLFVIGRVLFWMGYDRGAVGRALGFGLTFYPSVAGLVVGMVAGLS